VESDNKGWENYRKLIIEKMTNHLVSKIIQFWKLKREKMEKHLKPIRKLNLGKPVGSE